MADLTNLNEINTRIALKYDSLTNWIANDPVLLKGEIAIATIDTSEATDDLEANNALANVPNVIIKVGDGIHPFTRLKVVSGLAADVHSWAKETKKPEYTAGEIEGLEGYIKDRVNDTDTQYQIVKDGDYNYKYKLQSKSLTGNWEDVDCPAIDLTELDTRINDITKENGVIDTAINALKYLGKEEGSGKFITNVTQENGVIDVTSKDLEVDDIPQLPQSKITDLSTVLGNKQDKLEIADSYNATNNKVATETTVTEAIKALKNADLEKGSSTYGSNPNIIIEITQEEGIVSATYQPLKDILPDYIDSNNQAPNIVSSVNQTDGIIEVTHSDIKDFLTIKGKYTHGNEEEGLASVDYVDDQIGDVNEKIGELTSALRFVGVSSTDPESGVVTINGEVYGSPNLRTGDVVLYDTDNAGHEYVYINDKWVRLGSEGVYAIKAEVNTSINSINDQIEGINTAMDTLEDSIEGKITKKIEDINVTDTAIDGQFVIAVNQQQGYVAVTRGEITYDHIKEGEKLLVFNCGSASTNITEPDDNRDLLE